MPALTNKGRTVANVMRRSVRFRESGRWPAWRRHTPEFINRPGWVSEVRQVVENGVFSVLLRDVETALGVVVHAMITPADKVEPTWPEKQRIKDEVIGRGRTAVEVMPPHDEIVNAADSWHLWVLPEGMALPFSLATRGGAEEAV